MNIVVIIGIGITLLLLLWVAGRNRAVVPTSSATTSDLDGCSAYLPPRALLARCFSAEDVAFIDKLQSRQLSKLLFQERRRLALEWLRQTRREAARVFRAHVRMVRHAADLRPGMECRLLWHAGSFFVVYQFLQLVVRLYGPVRAHAFVHSVSALGGILSDLGTRIAGLAFPTPVVAEGTRS